MTENSLALTVTLFAALLALVSGMVWLSYRKHQYLLWLRAALLLAAVATSCRRCMKVICRPPMQGAP